MIDDPQTAQHHPTSNVRSGFSYERYIARFEFVVKAVRQYPPSITLISLGCLDFKIDDIDKTGTSLASGLVLWALFAQKKKN
jgi:hypothetical protein